jgi:Rrf2 family transcriptional regulator, nitric oxide-sensitive transcriptional repressor
LADSRRVSNVISQTTEYALRIVVYLASLQGRPATTAQIAQATSTPQQYLAKILRNLARGGLVVSQRGLGGGSTLARPAEQVTVYDVVQVVEPIERIRVCPLGLKTHSVKLCPLHHKIDTALELVENLFRNTTIRDVVAEPNRPTPLVEGEPIVPASGLVAARVLRRAKSSG